MFSCYDQAASDQESLEFAIPQKILSDSLMFFPGGTLTYMSHKKHEWRLMQIYIRLPLNGTLNGTLTLTEYQQTNK